jgi:predicted ATPase
VVAVSAPQHGNEEITVTTPTPAPPAAEDAAVQGQPFDRQRAVAVDSERWREAAQLRHDHAGWAVIWLAEAGEFRAYGRLPSARRDTALSAATAGDLAAQIEQAEQSAHTAATRRDPK